MRARVGEIDQTAHAKNIETWVKGKRSRPFIRGVHFSESEDGRVFIRHLRFEPTFRPEPANANGMRVGATTTLRTGPSGLSSDRQRPP